MNQAGNIKGAYTVVQRNTEHLKIQAADYRVERDGLDELRVRSLVWVDRVVRVVVECVEKAVRDSVCLNCVSRVGLDSVWQGDGGWDGKWLDVVQ